MKNLLAVLLFAPLLLGVQTGFAQSASPVSFSFTNTRLNDQEILVTVKAVIKPGVKLYSLNKVSEDAPYSSLSFDSSFSKQLQGTAVENGKLQEENDKTLNSKVRFFADSVSWTQKLAIAQSDS